MRHRFMARCVSFSIACLMALWLSCGVAFANPLGFGDGNDLIIDSGGCPPGLKGNVCSPCTAEQLKTFDPSLPCLVVNGRPIPNPES